MINRLQIANQWLEFDGFGTQTKLLMNPTSTNFAQIYMSELVNVKNDDLLGFLLAILPYVENKESEQKQSNHQQIASHYDTSNTFFRLWLDKSLTYTCGYWDAGVNDLQTAQSRKVNKTISQLDIQPDMAVCDLGCGWGHLAGAIKLRQGMLQVHAYNISEEQLSYARKVSPYQGIFIRGSWEDVSQQYDRVVSIGMLEHVGKANIPKFCEKLKSILKPDGKALLHFISKPYPEPIDQWIGSEIFHGAYVPSLGELIDCLGQAGLEVRGIENWREHYIKTLQAWCENFKNAKEQILALEGFNEALYRKWWLYLNAALASYMLGTLWLSRVEIVHKRTIS